MLIRPESSSSSTSSAIAPPSSQVSAAAGRTARKIRASANATDPGHGVPPSGQKVHPAARGIKVIISEVPPGRSSRNRLPRPGRALDAEVAAVSDGDAAGDGEAETGPVRARVPAAEEPLEDPGQLGRLDARSVVPDREPDRARRGFPDAHLDPSAGLGELDRVGHEVGKGELHPLPVADERDRRLGAHDAERDPLPCRRRPRGSRPPRRPGRPRRDPPARGPRCRRRAARGPAGSPRSSAACRAGGGPPPGTPGARPRRPRPAPAAAR